MPVLVKEQMRNLRDLKKCLGVPSDIRFSRISRLRADTILRASGCEQQIWFWRRWFLICFYALERATEYYKAVEKNDQSPR